MPGVFIHANAINTMLTASYLDVNSNATTVMWVTALRCWSRFAVLFLPLWLSIVVTFVLSIAYLLLTALQFDNGHIMNSCTRSSRSASRSSPLMVRYFTETHRQRASRLFAQYVPETVAQQLVEEGRSSRPPKVSAST